MRLLSNILPILVTLVVATGVFKVSYGYFRSEEHVWAEGRLSLYESSVISELDRYSHLTHVLARDPYVIDTARGYDTGRLNVRLEGFAAQAGLDAIYLIGTDGFTISASNHRDSSSFIGHNYAFRPYFRDALTGKQGQFYAIGTTTGLPGYFIADAVRDQSGIVVGVIAIKIGLADLEDSWRNSGEQVFLANRDGVVLLSSDPGWRYRVLAPLTDTQRNAIKAAKQFPGQTLEPLDWTVLSDQRAKIGDADRIHLTAQGLLHGWVIHYFVSDDRAVARSWQVTSLVVFAAGLALILLQIQKSRRVTVALQRSEQEEAQLRRANERLAVEIEVRKTAEQSLQRTQGELERTSRLAALGQLSASVTHELGQPIAAMRNHLAAAEIGANGPTALTGRIGGLVDRMEGITRQLKFFATPQTESFQDIDLNQAMTASLALVEPNIADASADIRLALSDTPAIMRGIRLRIEQVMTNLLRNAIDATDDCEQPIIDVHVGSTQTTVWFEIKDNGHGLGSATLADLQEPFVTTRESGRGMGLGLAISASIVKDHEGSMSASNTGTGGAVFRVTFPVHPSKEGHTT